MGLVLVLLSSGEDDDEEPLLRALAGARQGLLAAGHLHVVIALGPKVGTARLERLERILGSDAFVSVLRRPGESALAAALAGHSHALLAEEGALECISGPTFGACVSLETLEQSKGGLVSFAIGHDCALTGAAGVGSVVTEAARIVARPAPVQSSLLPLPTAAKCKAPPSTGAAQWLSARGSMRVGLQGEATRRPLLVSEAASDIKAEQKLVRRSFA